MKDLSTWGPSSDKHFENRKIVAFDLDDTLTHDGSLPASIVAALEKAQSLGWMTLLVTGRSAGWVDALIKLLPLDAIVGENGALLYFWPNLKRNRKVREEARKLFWTPRGYALKPPEDIAQMHKKGTESILKKYPRARVASDQPYRIYDLAIDFAEEVDPPLSLEDAKGIQAEFENLGAQAKVSSIHVNGWWGNFTKEIGLRELLEKHYKLSLETQLIYTGDSPNDGPLFAVSGMSVGVANIKSFVGKVEFSLPTYITQKQSAHGALELFEMLTKRT